MPDMQEYGIFPFRSTDAYFTRKAFEECGVITNGQNPWDPTIKDSRFYQRIKRHGSVGLGDSYMENWWECEDIAGMIKRLLAGDIRKHFEGFRIWCMYYLPQLINWSRWRPYEVANRHYSLGIKLYELMLDKRLVYSCGYWENATTLNEAQEAKLDLICRKLDLRNGQILLDIGCGWGSLMAYAAERYDAICVGLTVSKPQASYINTIAKRNNLRMIAHVGDWSHFSGGRYDAVASIGMFEHVGWRNYRKFFRIVSGILKPNGRFLLHTMGSAKTFHTGDPWVRKRIFPNSSLGSRCQIERANGNTFYMKDWHTFDQDYYPKTLRTWFNQFSANWDEIKKDGGYDDAFYRMWEFYLLSFAGAFEAEKILLWQILFSREQGHIEEVR
ncbi:MAG: cyclopropane-fatty-acyl-phospholipid synthase [Candidatus Ryanbacteria bacterium CG10_big_fil_rev_8_21_14_0_10_43_42]|uniref:Cyclopropane-fatty-acyl-phospholipid synthase n=1 Tax=Candidatus Ryanbacteria bacterium CG10_big_fil_rev_8_21_14_0_10_43_42 TaxID=1974864 RepID=A0A2M8KVV5_9BACT|nr:MAG: cyclopropane-fatty-acyl-phospholipid synthase [Candidatus Ryanbacteria bacterium CG10_big_fil_rev_8_21_14_0_10_43_42]